MKAILTSLCILAATLFATAQEQNYQLIVDNFSRLKVKDGLSVDYRCNADSAGYVVFTARPDEAAYIGVTNKKGELTVALTAQKEHPTVLPKVTVYSSYLTSVENTGDGAVRVLNNERNTDFSAKLSGDGSLVVRDVRADRVKAKITLGSGQIVIYGDCDEASLNMTGKGLIQADGLKAKEVKCSAYGTGSIGCYPTEILKIHGMASTTIYYRGNPEIINRALGVKIEPLSPEK